MSIPVAEASAPQAAPPAPPRPAPLASRVIDTFFSPGKVFEQFREGPAPWLGPVLVCVALFAVTALIRPLFISDQQMVDFTVEKMREMGREPPPADAMAKGMMIQTVVSIVFLTIWMFLRVALVGLILFGVYALAMGGRNDLRPYFAVASHAFLVSAVGFAVLAALQYATGRLDITLDAALLAPGADPKGLLVKVLHGITPWGIWLVCLLALGGATINRRKGWVGAAAILFSLQMVLVLGIAMIMQMAAGRAPAAG